MKKFILALLVVALAVSCAYAWTPKKNVTVIVAYKAGSGTDNTARVLSKYSFGGESRLDLFMADTTKHKGWINIYKRPEGYEDGGKIFESKEAAYNGRGYIGVPATTIEIEWED